MVALGRGALARADGVGGGVTGAQGGVQQSSGWCWAGPAVAEGAAGMWVGLRVSQGIAFPDFWIR